MSQSSFKSLPLSKALLSTLDDLGYRHMTPIQELSLPHLLEGKDVIGKGKTGTGKTVAFGLDVLHRLEVKRFRIQTLILCPTRELADQVAKEIRKLARGIHNIKVLTLCGGVPIGPQIGSLAHGAHIVVGTPGRIEDHLRKQTLDLSNVHTFVLDEADRMLDMGFLPAVESISQQVPVQRQTLLFSATYPSGIRKIAAQIMQQPITVEAPREDETQTVQQALIRLENIDRLAGLEYFLQKHSPALTLIFCNFKQETDDVADHLANHGFAVRALHGDLDQRQRDEALTLFANRSLSILVATDVAARGIDIDEIDLVINYHLAKDSDVHTHRIGRTGRAGKQGEALTLYEAAEQYKADRLIPDLPENTIQQTLSENDLTRGSDNAISSWLPPMQTLQIDGGKKKKIRPGDILGALTSDKGILGSQVGKISVFDYCAYVAVERKVARQALRTLETGKLKGRSFRVRRIRA